MILVVSCNRCNTAFVTTLMCLTDINILTVAAITINFKDIFNDCNMSVAMAVAHFNLIHDC
jgi:hypothetical protein